MVKRGRFVKQIRGIRMVYDRTGNKHRLRKIARDGKKNGVFRHYRIVKGKQGHELWIR